MPSQSVRSKFKLRSLELKSFFELSNNNKILKNRLNKLTEKAKNGENIRKIVIEEIMPIVQEKNFNFTTNELINYIKFNTNKLTENEMKKISGGISAGKLTFGIANGVIGLTSLINSGVFANDSVKSIDKSKEKSSSNFNKQNIEEGSYDTGSNLNSLLNEENKDVINNNNEQLKTDKESLNEIDIMGNSTYEITKLENLEGEKAVHITKLINNNKMSRIPDDPPNVKGNLINTQENIHQGTVFVIPKNINCSFDSNSWSQINTKDGKAILIHKNSKAYDHKDEILNLRTGI